MDEVEVSVVQGSDRNIKITRPTDIDLARCFSRKRRSGGMRREPNWFRTGLGWDVHRIAPGRTLILGGVTFPRILGSTGTPTPTSCCTPLPTRCWERPRWATSDALSGHCPQWKCSASAKFLEHAAALVKQADFRW